MRESDIEDHLVDRVERAGGEIRKVRWIGRRSAPDRRVMLNGWPPFWVELKAPGEKLEAHQAREHERMKKYGETIYVFDNIEAIDKFLERAEIL